ncbi:MAG: VCBS repeat-containing protein [Planctomycetia bacterium]|nr:VCBS repeat-containing protein [Planctomycetia bacterium]
MPLLLLVPIVLQASPIEFDWAGAGHWRVLVRVEPAAREADPRGSPRVDERPADVRIEFARLLERAGVKQAPDLASVEVIRHDAASGKPLAGSSFAFARGKYDVPFRWYDAAIPYQFPDCDANLATSGGKLPRKPRPRTGYFYETIGDARDGRMAFVHRDDGEVAWYAVYFDLLPADKQPDRPPPRGFVGDGLNRCEPVGHSTTGLIHNRVDVVDWNGDGLADLLVGCGRGGIVWYANAGSAGDWKFPVARLLATSDGEPIDVGNGASPHAVDFDGDGRFDLLTGAERNRVVWFRNTGGERDPALEYMGLVEADGRPLELPVTPVPEGPDVFKLDYYPLLESVDWDDDGDLDLLAGGYITGRIYLYENTAGRRAPMRLRFAGAIDADGAPIDVSWAAAPTVGDLDGDGDLDLVSGCMPMTPGGGDSSTSESFLHYFENVGTRKEPQFRAARLPREGEFPHAGLGSPRLVDFNKDGLLDLVVSAGMRIYMFPNIGTRTAPKFRADVNALPGAWGNAPLAGTQFFDWDGDGHVDGIDGPKVYRNLGRGSPGLFASPVSLLRPGQRIDHLSGIGDDWTFQRLYDLDGDGRIDLMDADHAGHIWWHRNRAKPPECDFEAAGVRLSLVDGSPLLVGGERTGFDALQGARATYAVADCDGDGRADLVTTDTFGDVRFFRQARREEGAEPRFEPHRSVGKLRIRGAPAIADWNGDGRPDIVAGSRAEDVQVFLGQTGPADRLFAPGRLLDLPPAPDGAGAPLAVTDYNGDGDLDIILHTAYGYTCFYERSFIDHGYARGEAVRIEVKPQ